MDENKKSRDKKELGKFKRKTEDSGIPPKMNDDDERRKLDNPEVLENDRAIWQDFLNKRKRGFNINIKSDMRKDKEKELLKKKNKRKQSKKSKRRNRK